MNPTRQCVKLVELQSHSNVPNLQSSDLETNVTVFIGEQLLVFLVMLLLTFIWDIVFKCISYNAICIFLICKYFSTSLLSLGNKGIVDIFCNF